VKPPQLNGSPAKERGANELDRTYSFFAWRSVFQKTRTNCGRATERIQIHEQVAA